MNNLHDLIESQLVENRTNRVKGLVEETSCLGISVAITNIENVREVKESNYLPDGLRKVIVWRDGKEYEITIKLKIK